MAAADARAVKRRGIVLGAVAALAVTIGTIGRAVADDYPSRPITIVVPATAGGPTDTLTRIIADRLRVLLGQTIVIENQGAAGGSVAVGRVARAAPDGYTACIGHFGHFVLNGAIYALPYDVLQDFEPVALLAANPQLVVARKDMPANTLKELIGWLSANSGKATQGTAGAGSPAHIAGLYFQKMTGTTFQFVPYRGAAPAMQDLLAGRIDLMFDQSSNALPQIRAGSIKVYAVTANARLAAAPEIPSADEAGLPGFYVSVWHGLWVPKGTPQAVVAKLNAAVVEALADPVVGQQLAKLGQTIPPREQLTAEAVRKLQQAEAQKWWPIIKAAHIKAE
jgi:tripartite-type tricarboxylate transporter receptor subunit TctC